MQKKAVAIADYRLLTMQQRSLQALANQHNRAAFPAPALQQQAQSGGQVVQRFAIKNYDDYNGYLAGEGTIRNVDRVKQMIQILNRGQQLDNREPIRASKNVELVKLAEDADAGWQYVAKSEYNSDDDDDDADPEYVTKSILTDGHHRFVAYAETGKPMPAIANAGADIGALFGYSWSKMGGMDAVYDLDPPTPVAAAAPAFAPAALPAAFGSAAAAAPAALPAAFGSAAPAPLLPAATATPAATAAPVPITAAAVAAAAAAATAAAKPVPVAAASSSSSAAFGSAAAPAFAPAPLPAAYGSAAAAATAVARPVPAASSSSSAARAGDRKDEKGSRKMNTAPPPRRRFPAAAAASASAAAMESDSDTDSDSDGPDSQTMTYPLWKPLALAELGTRQVANRPAKQVLENLLLMAYNMGYTPSLFATMIEAETW